MLECFQFEQEYESQSKNIQRSVEQQTLKCRGTQMAVTKEEKTKIKQEKNEQIANKNNGERAALRWVMQRTEKD